MKTIINTLIWMVSVSCGLAVLIGVAWLFQHYPWLGVVALIGLVSWLGATVCKWPLKGD